MISDKLIEEGQHGRAFLRALRASLEWAIGSGIAGATIGYRVGGVDGAVVGGIGGGTLGLVTGSYLPLRKY